MWSMLILVLGVAGCSGAEPNPEVITPVEESIPVLTPYQPRVPVETQAPTQTPLPTSTQPPLPTPTPFVHVVAAGETMIGIAYNYGISLDLLSIANPDINPSYLSIGTQLIIPLDAEGAESVVMPSAEIEVLPVANGAISCISNRMGGMWCFWPVTNSQEQPIENLAGLVRLYDETGEELLSQPVYGLVNLLKPGETTVLGTYFNPPLPDWSTVQGQITSAAAANQVEARYLESEISNMAVLPDEHGGLTAKVSGEIAVQGVETDTELAYLWVVASVYDDAGQVVGMRRWEANPETLAVLGGEAIEFSFLVYSLGRPIAEVEILTEARILGE